MVKWSCCRLVGRKIPIVADDYADPEQGSGAVKITPAHDFNDFEVGRRNDLPAINMMDMHGCIDLTDEAFAEMIGRDSWQGLDRMEARKRVVQELDALGLVAEIEDNTHMVPFGDRSGQIIEPWLTDQWYVDAATLAKPAIAAVRDGRTKFVPQNWEKLILTGWKISSLGVFRASFGGGIVFLLGMGRMVKFLLLWMKRKRKLRPMLITARQLRYTAMRMFSILGFLPRFGRFQHWVGRKRPTYWHGIIKPMCLSPALTLFSSGLRG